MLFAGSKKTLGVQLHCTSTSGQYDPSEKAWRYSYQYQPQTVFLLFSQVTGRQSHNKSMLSAFFPFTDMLARLDAIHNWHVQVHEYNIEFLEFNGIESFQPIGNYIDVM